MIGFKEKAFGLLALVGLWVAADRGYDFWLVDHLKKYGALREGIVRECVPYNERTKSRGDERLKMVVRYQGCKERCDQEFVVFRKYELPQKGKIALLSNGNCPETVILRDAPNDAWKEALVGVLVLSAGSAGFFSGYLRVSRK